MEDISERYGARQKIGLFVGVAAFLLMLVFPAPSGLSESAWRVAALGVLMSIFWLSEALPITITAFLPIIFLPTLGVCDVKDATAPFANSVIFLFLGGFMIALAVERHGLHRRIALWILSKVTPEPRSIVLGFMATTAFISMWVSNAATAMMMFPIGASVVELVNEHESDAIVKKHFSINMMLGIAYASSIGGLGTLVGTPPNALFAAFVSETYSVKVSFLQWFLLGAPLVLISLPLSWWIMVRVAFPIPLAPLEGGRATIEKEFNALGKMSRGEVSAACVFIVTAMLWMLEPALSEQFPKLKISDAGIAIAGAVALFLIPINFKEGEFALSWESAKKLPWGVLMLFGGGLSLAQAISKTKLAEWLAKSMQGVEALPLALIILVIAAAMIFLSELMSNTALAATFFPVVAPLAVAMGQNPFFLLLPTAIGVSTAFMLPVGTPPNAIVYASGSVTAAQMARAGLFLNLLFVALITVAMYFLMPIVFGVEFGVVPDWATKK